MNKRFVFKLMYLLSVCFLISSCTNKAQQQRNEALQKKLDSIEQVNIQHEEEIEEVYSFISEISNGLDSIVLQDNLLRNTTTKDGKIMSKAQIRENLKNFSNAIDIYKNRLAQISDSLKSRNNAQIQKLTVIISSLQSQLEDKSNMIASLRKDLDNKNITITQITNKVNELTSTNVSLNNTISSQNKLIADKEEELSVVYVKIGTKKELKELGLLSGGFLKKKTINLEEQSKFDRIHRSNFNHKIFNTKNIKILTPQPASSYEIIVDKQSKTSTLDIINPEVFWASKFLIIQID